MKIFVLEPKGMRGGSCVVLFYCEYSLVREDGLCGPGNKAPNGKDAKCEHIPPFPTCCQPNGHCGWECDNGE
jgi:hypothetical protein